MPSAPSTVSRNASARFHEVHIANHNGGIYRVASVTATTVVLSDASDLTGKSLYAVSTPGMLVIVEGVNASDVGKTANITGVSSNTLTVSVDFATTPALAADDLVAVIPPMAASITTNGGHTIHPNRTKDETLGMGESVLTHNTALQVDVSGQLPGYMCRDSQAFARVLLAAIGGYKKSGTGIHKYRPYQFDDATFSEAKDFCLYSKEGNQIIEQVFLGLMPSQLDLNFPNLGVATYALQVLGTHAVREVGGTGKTFLTGSNNWDRGSDIERDSGNRHVYNGVFAKFGGSFGDALGTSYDRFVLDASVQIQRGLADDFPLGSQERAIPIEDTVGVMVTGRRILEDDTIYQDFFGTSADATPGQQTETRLHLKAVAPGDTTKTLDIDIPKGVWTVDDVVRQRGRFVESFTFRGIQTITGGDYDTANPLYEVTLANGNDVDLLTAL